MVVVESQVLEMNILVLISTSVYGLSFAADLLKWQILSTSQLVPCNIRMSTSLLSA